MQEIYSCFQSKTKKEYDKLTLHGWIFLSSNELVGDYS